MTTLSRRLTIFPAALALAALLVAQRAGAGGPDTTGTAARHRVPPGTGELTVEQLRALESMRALFSDCLPGTDFCVEYLWDANRPRYEIGDRLRLTCRLLESDGASAPCDSFSITAVLGADQLPVGIEWVLLSPSDLSEPVSMAPPLLASSFRPCGRDPRGVAYLRIAIADRDSTGRADWRSRSLERAILLCQDDSSAAAVPLLRAAVERRPKSILARVFYAGALSGSDQCEAYLEQWEELARRGYSTRSISREEELKYCRGWNGHRDDAK